MIKTIYMESTIQYFKEILGNGTHPIANHIMTGVSKITKDGIKYVLVEEIEDNFIPAA